MSDYETKNPDAAPDVFYKSANGVINIDQAKGIVECVVAAIGNKDSVNDIIMPGAFTASLKRRKPRVVWGHNWNEPIGKVLSISEVPSSDPRLPPKMKAAGVGGLLAKVQFNLNSPRGQQAFADVAFFGEEQEWSIGYKTIRAVPDPAKGANLLYELELYEVSPVLHGANQLTGTLTVKTDNHASTAYTNESATSSNAVEYTITYSDATTDFGFEQSQVKGEQSSGEAKEYPLILEALKGALGRPVMLRTVGPREVIYDIDSEGTHMSRYRSDGSRFIFSPPRKVRIRTIIEPIPEEEPVCRCGRHMGKSAEEGMEEKAGRVISTRNLAKLQQAVDLLSQILSSAQPQTGEPLEQKFSKKDYLLAAAASDPWFGVGDVDALSGLMLEGKVGSVEQVADLMDSIDRLIDPLGIHVVLPTEVGVKAGEPVRFLFPPGDAEGKVQAIFEAMAEQDIEFASSLKIVKLDFCCDGKKSLQELVQGKRLNEVFTAK